MASALARRYAAAAFDVGRERDRVPALGQDLQRARAIIGDPRVQAVLTNPRVSMSHRAGAVAQLLADLSPPARNLVTLLVTRGRIHLLDDVVTDYLAMAEAASGVVRAVVTSALPLDDATARRIERVLTGRLDRKVQIEPVHDPEIIGGLVVRVGDRVIDDSLRTHLQQLQATMA